MKAVHLIRNSLLTGVCIGLLTGCSWLDDWPPKNSEMAVKTAPRPPESKMEETSNAGWPGADRKSGQAASKGIAVDDASAARIAKLEQEISAIHNQLEMMMPALTKLAEAQGDIHRALTQVEPAAGGMAQVAGDYGQTYNGQPTPTPITGQQPVAAAPQPSAANGYQQQAQAPAQQYGQQSASPAPGSVDWYEQQERQNRQVQQNNQQAVNSYQPPVQQRPVQQQQPAYQPAAQQQATYQQASYGGDTSGTTITGLRLGEHPDKTRLVLDASDKAAFNYDVDNNEMLLTVSLPGASWRGATQMALDSSPLISSYNVVSDGAGGQKVVMQLRQPVRVLWAQSLQPGGPQGHRVVFDLAPL